VNTFQYLTILQWGCEGFCLQDLTHLVVYKLVTNISALSLQIYSHMKDSSFSPSTFLWHITKEYHYLVRQTDWLSIYLSLLSHWYQIGTYNNDVSIWWFPYWDRLCWLVTQWFYLAWSFYRCLVRISLRKLFRNSYPDPCWLHWFAYKHYLYWEQIIQKSYILDNIKGNIRVRTS
jgi:hypothetical protein